MVQLPLCEEKNTRTPFVVRVEITRDTGPWKDTGLCVLYVWGLKLQVRWPRDNSLKRLLSWQHLMAHWNGQNKCGMEVRLRQASSQYTVFCL